MKHLFLTTLLLLSLCTSAVFGQITDERRQKALELLEVSGSKQAVEQVRESIRLMMMQQFSQLPQDQQNQETAQAVQEETIAWMDEFLTWENLQDMYVEIYADVFTVEEMDAIIEFYKSEAGQKMLEKTPELVRKSMEVTQKQVMEKMPEFQQRIEKKLQEAETGPDTGAESPAAEE